MSQSLSITGVALNLESISGSQGMYLTAFFSALLMSSAGNCVSIESFEKLNQLGEGSQCFLFLRSCHNERMLTLPSVWRCISGPRL